MVIIGPKYVPDEEPEPVSKGKNQIFTIKWIKDITQNFSSPNNKIGEGGFGPSSSDHNKKKWGKRKVGFGVPLDGNMVCLGDKSRQNEEELNRGEFSLRQIEDATQNFSQANILGKGGFGSVYKGFLPDRTAIAVKKLSYKSSQGITEFKSEVNTISTITHPNLIKLLGSCTVNEERILVYEYMENDSLLSALFGANNGRNLKDRLDWPRRAKICLGIAKGIAFLHDDKSKAKIIHRDIKLSNVLLDEYLNPKISDFGLAAQYNDEDQTHISTVVKGSFGYLDPEYFKTQRLTEKADVYSFGILILELMSGRRCLLPNLPRESVSLKEVADDLERNGDLLALIDEDLKASISVEEASVVLHLAMLCTKDSSHLRPTMPEVERILDGVVSNIFEGRTKMKNLPPPQDFFLSSTRVDPKNTTTDLSVDHLSNTSTETKMEDELSTKVEDEGELEYVELSFEEGRHHIECSDEEFEAGCSEWKDSLVGYILDDNEPFNVDKGMVEKLWEVTGNVSVFSMGNGYFLFQFDCVDDKIRVLESSDLWHIKQRPLILRKWDWKMKFDKTDEMKSLPVWVKIYKLPLFLLSSSLLSKVGSGLGNPLYVDHKTKNRERLDYAKLCIEFDASKPLPESLDISVKGVNYQLNLEYDWRPLRCANCCNFGHLESKCGLESKETEQN